MTYSEPARTIARNRRRSLAALAIVALIVTGCSSSPADTSTSGGGDSDNAATGRQQAVQFAECMRENGVRAFPDPDASGELTIDGVLNGSSLDADTPAWKTAVATCKDLQPAGFTGRERTPEQQEQTLQFAQCIRENGVEDFPDPAEGEPLVDTNRIPSAATDAGMSALNAAMRTCRDFAAGIVTGP